MLKRKLLKSQCATKKFESLMAINIKLRGHPMLIEPTKALFRFSHYG